MPHRRLTQRPRLRCSLWWQDYAPSGINRCNGEKFKDDELLYTTKTNETLGSKAFKALYVQYVSGKFQTESPHPEWLGLLGPLIQTQVLHTRLVLSSTILSDHLVSFVVKKYIKPLIQSFET